MLQISELFIYPIKSLPGVAVQSARVTEKGLEHDRRWMLVDENNNFLSQREHAIMTQLQVSIENSGLKVINKKNQDSLYIPFKVENGEDTINVTVWDDTCQAEYVNKNADDWFSTALEMKCRLVYMPDKSKRTVDQRYAPEDAVTSFADAYPFLLIGQASLDDLNSRISEALPMDRFRPNIVFTGGEPYEEDLIADFTAGNINFSGVKLCARCVMTVINQDTGVKGKEPLKTLATYRLKNKKILFGQNLIHQGEGIISVGDELHVNSRQHEERFMVGQNPIPPSGIDIDKTFGIIAK